MALRVRCRAFRGVFTVLVAARALRWTADQEGGALDGGGGHAQRCGQPVHRDHADVAIVALTSRAVVHTEHGEGARSDTSADARRRSHAA